MKIPEKRNWIESKIKIGRIGKIEDIMGAVVYLASDASSLVTGSSLLVDGGWTAGLSNTKITSAEVAKLAGVSQSAVSRVFTPGASASKTTAERVKKAAYDLGYRPNVLARAMVSGKSRIIGIIVAYLENQFYPEALEKLSNVLQSKGYHALIFMAGKNMQSIDGVIEEILDYQVDGIITASVSMSSNLTKRCKNVGVPMVLFNRSQDVSKMSSVTSDNIKGGKKIADFLLSLGHKKLDILQDGKVLPHRGIVKKDLYLRLNHSGNKSIIVKLVILLWMKQGRQLEKCFIKILQMLFLLLMIIWLLQ